MRPLKTAFKKLKEIVYIESEKFIPSEVQETINAGSVIGSISKY